MTFISNVVVSKVAAGGNMLNNINAVIYEISADVAPGGTGTEPFEFDIPSSRLITDASGVPVISTGNPHPVMFGASSDTFPSLLDKLSVPTADNQAARAVLFRDPKLNISASSNHGAVKVGLDAISVGGGPGIHGSVVVDLVYIPIPFQILVTIVCIVASDLA
jgi:hypothetical protein